MMAMVQGGTHDVTTSQTDNHRIPATKCNNPHHSNDDVFDTEMASIHK